MTRTESLLGPNRCCAISTSCAYSYTKSAPIDYPFHSTVSSGYITFGANEQLDADYTWRFILAGSTGTADITMTFNYIVRNKHS